MVSKAPKLALELAKQELQLKRKRARGEKLQQRQGALVEDAGEQPVVFKKKSKRNKERQESNADGTKREHEFNPNNSGEKHNLDLNSSRNGLSLNPKSSMIQQCMNQERCENEDMNPESINNGQQLSSKRRKKEQNSNYERSNKGQKLNSKSSEIMHNSNSECSFQGQKLPDAIVSNEKTLKASMDVKDMKKKSKKKRDRWGQVLNVAGNTHDTSHNDIDADMLDNVGKPQDVAYTDGHDTLAERESHEAEYDNKTVCAGGMPYETREEDIRGFFQECGAVTRVICMKFADTQRFKGLAFITFQTETAASKALSLDGTNMGDRLIKVEKARAGGKVLRAPPKRDAGSLSVYVGNLDWGVQKTDIKRFFKGCDIDDVRLAVDKSTGDFRGYGHVDFSDEKSLEKAIKMNQKQLLGRPVKVSYAVPKGFKRKSG